MSDEKPADYKVPVPQPEELESEAEERAEAAERSTVMPRTVVHTAYRGRG